MPYENPAPWFIILGVIVILFAVHKVRERRAEVRARKLARSMAAHPAGKGLR